MNNLNNKQRLGIAIIFIVTGIVLFAIAKYWYADYLYQRSIDETQLTEFKSSLKDIQSAISIVPGEANYHNQMARMLLSLSLAISDESDATSAAQFVPYVVSETNVAFRLSPRNMNVRQTRITALYELSNFNPAYLDEALQLTKDTIPLSPTDPKMELLLGKIYIKMGRIPEAVNAYKYAIKLKLDYQDARFDLGVTYKALKDNIDAKEEFQYILDHISPNDTNTKQELESLK